MWACSVRGAASYQSTAEPAQSEIRGTAVAPCWEIALWPAVLAVERPSPRAGRQLVGSRSSDPSYRTATSWIVGLGQPSGADERCYGAKVPR